MITLDILMVGSIAYDSVTSPAGTVENALGGSAVYAGIASRFHGNYLDLEKIGLVGVVGQDFRSEDIAMLESQGLDLSGLEVAEGKTFRWEGSYHGDMGVAKTHDTQLNVFGDFDPKVPSESTTPKVLFCANLVPMLQSKVLQQAKGTRISMLDSMNLWIEIAKDDLLAVMKSVDLIIINDGEVRMLAQDDNLIRASRALIKIVGCQTLIIKKGENGVVAFHDDEIIS
ncbi:MAG TPA: sugar kinase, partial [Candidatus Poseidoniales archaeon]